MTEAITRFKRGDTSPDKPGLVFSSYLKNGTFEYWVTPEKLERDRARCAKHAMALRQTDRHRQYAKEYRRKANQRDHVKARKEEWRKSPNGKASQKRYRERNKDVIAARKLAYSRLPHVKEKSREKSRLRDKAKHRTAVKRWKKTPYGKLSENLRRRISLAFAKGGYTKRSRTHELLGCDYEFFKGWLEAKFQRGMSWANYGTFWHVDHIKGVCNFDLNCPEQQKLAFHYTNCQPLWADENMRKNRY